MKIPKFKNQIINELYEYEENLSFDTIDAILALPRESVISDLQLVLEESILNFEYYKNEIELSENGFFVIHSCVLLNELNSTESLPVILKALSQSEEYIEFFIGEFITHYFWEIYFNLGKNQLDLLYQFFKQKDVYEFAAIEIAVAVTQIVIYYPERFQEISDWFTKLYAFFISIPPNYYIENSCIIDLSILSSSDLAIEAHLPLIEKIFETHDIEMSVTGTYDVMKEIILSKKHLINKRKQANIKELYTFLLEQETDNHELTNQIMDDFRTNFAPSTTSKKPGRNDPCFCGSGKKYKKCCINN